MPYVAPKYALRKKLNKMTDIGIYFQVGARYMPKDIFP
jgi:hypothetical protein